MEKIKTSTGIEVDAIFINDYDNGSKLFYSQDRLVITTDDNVEIDNVCILPTIIRLKERAELYNEIKQNQLESQTNQ